MRFSTFTPEQVLLLADLAYEMFVPRRFGLHFGQKAQFGCVELRKNFAEVKKKKSMVFFQKVRVLASFIDEKLPKCTTNQKVHKIA